MSAFFPRAQNPFNIGGGGQDGRHGNGGGLGGGLFGPSSEAEEPTPMSKAARILAISVLVIILGLGALVGIYTDVLWFTMIGFAPVFWGIIGYKVAFVALWAVISMVLVGLNVWVPYKVRGIFTMRTPALKGAVQGRSYLTMTGILTLLIGIMTGAAAMPLWQEFALYVNRQPFNKPDPHFGIDIGFFVFELPMLHMAASTVFSLLVISTIAGLGGHVLWGGIKRQGKGWAISKAANAHISVLIACLIVAQVVRYWLARYDLSYSPRGRVVGLSYTDVHAELRAYELLVGIGIVCALVFIYTAVKGGWILPIASVGVFFSASLLLSGVYPELIQRFQVAPQELPQERQYIARNLEMTRWAFNIDDDYVSYEPFEAHANLTRQQAIDNTSILNSIRVWDPHTLRNTYKQLQELRPYYDFTDVDVSRFPIDGHVQQVLLAVREIQTNSLNEKTWQNQTTLYTHGYGLVSSTVSTAAADGQPEFLSRDIPARGNPIFDLKQPRIYYGETSPAYSIVGTDGDEFDYETEESQAFTRYEGKGGVPVGSIINRAAYALRFRELNILLSTLITPESRILYNRNVRDRVHMVAPFLSLERDAYPAVVDGRIKWIQDAYTLTAQVPYSEFVDLGPTTSVREREVIEREGKKHNVIVDKTNLQGRANYMRNSVKAIVDAYDGTVQLVVVDDKDPILGAWRHAFPDAFVPMSTVSPELKAQFRHPEGMFRVQSNLLLSYHIQDPDAFYNKSDKWQLPPDRAFSANAGVKQDQGRTFPPSYQLVKLPGDKHEDFSLIQPFSPADREVLAAYMAASGNPDTLGKIRIFTMPPTETVFGPSQVFARINQDSEISQLITLLSDKQSQIIYGNLIIVPVEQSLLYALPLFLKSEQSEIPELRRVILVYGNQVIMQDRLSEALEELFGTIPQLETGEKPSSSSGKPGKPAKGLTLDGAGRKLVQDAITYSAKAQEALAAGKLGDYQTYTTKANDALKQLEKTYKLGAGK